MTPVLRDIESETSQIISKLYWHMHTNFGRDRSFKFERQNLYLSIRFIKFNAFLSARTSAVYLRNWDLNCVHILFPIHVQFCILVVHFLFQITLHE